jgi:serine/threonine protein kinase
MLEEVRRASTIVGGTPYYMAPEQGAGGDIDHRADLYAFGVTLFQLLTGGLPFPDGDVAYQHRHVAPPDPRELVPDLPAELAQLILQLLEKKPEARPANAAEVGRRLQALL